MKIPDSERLSYTLMSADDTSDAELLYQLDQDPEVMRHINNGKLTSREEIRDFYLPRLEKYTNTEKGWGLWKVCFKESGQFIGWVLVRPMKFFSDSPQWDNLELGWRFVSEFWGHGYATEAAQSIKQALIHSGLATRFCAIAVKENKASISIMKKLGMNYIKTYLDKDAAREVDVVYYEISCS
ncbi:MAG: GNAT family N-acetyltransferase [Gammaproteobacteria bacterium]|nr:GNAT family N-acetyltransferase [Gammaproteobacteria bacterium]MDH5630365.1 GNAT family N-acetyltransferase [Gammaproteobacteria bacterium]